MKKILIGNFIGVFIFFLSSCNSENKINPDSEQSTTKQVEEKKDENFDEIEPAKKLDIEIPQFQSEEANKFIKKYFTYAEKLKNAEEINDPETIRSLVQESPIIEKEKLNLMKSLSKDDIEKLKDFSLKLNQSINNDE